MTGIVLIVVAVTKAHEGAWIILLLIPVHVVLLPDDTKRHYDIVAAQLSLKGWVAELRAATTPSSSRSAASIGPSFRPSNTRRLCRLMFGPST